MFANKQKTTILSTFDSTQYYFVRKSLTSAIRIWLGARQNFCKFHFGYNLRKHAQQVKGTVYLKGLFRIADLMGG